MNALPISSKTNLETEAYILDFIERYQFSEEEHQVLYNQPQKEAITLLINKMTEYGYAYLEIEKVTNSVLHSQNAYINKENLKIYIWVNRINRRGGHIGDDIIKQFISLANQYKPEEKTEKAPLNEIIQIFA